MRKQRWIMLAFVGFVMIMLTVLSSASWFIIFRKTQTTEHVEVQADTSPYFTTGGTYNGVSQAPTLNAAGIAIYGDNMGDFDIVWNGGKRSDGKTGFNSSAEAMHAGTHYYTITHNKTGQVICENHEVVIGKATLDPLADISVNGYYLPEETVLPDGRMVKWTGKNGETFSATVLTGERAMAFGQHTSLVYTETKTVTTSVVTDVWTHNDYQEASVNISYKVVSTCYSYDGTTATYYSDLDTALTETAGAPSATTVVAMQSFSPDGTWTFTASPNATAGSTLKKFTHTISGNKVVGANVMLIVPYKETKKFDATEEMIVISDRHAISSTTTDADGKMEKESRFSATPNCVNQVKVTDGSTLNNKGNNK